MELSTQQHELYKKIRDRAGNALNAFHAQGHQRDFFTVGAWELTEELRRHGVRCDGEDAVAALNGNGALPVGWALQGTAFVFRTPVITQPQPPANNAPSVTADAMAKSLTAADRARIRWNHDTSLQRRYPSIEDFVKLHAMGLI